MAESEGDPFLYTWTWACLYIKSSNILAKTDFQVFKGDLYKKRWNEAELIWSTCVLSVYDYNGLMILLTDDNNGFPHDCVFFSNDG